MVHPWCKIIISFELLRKVITHSFNSQDKSLCVLNTDEKKSKKHTQKNTELSVRTFLHVHVLQTTGLRPQKTLIVAIIRNKTLPLEKLRC